MCNKANKLWDKQCNNNMRKHKINKVISLLKVKVEITTSGDDGDKDLLPKFLLLREVRIRLERVWNTMLTRSQRGPPYSPHALTNARCRDSTIGHLRAVTEPVQMPGEISTTELEAPEPQASRGQRTQEEQALECLCTQENKL